MAKPLDLTDILEKDEVENIYKRALSEKEWENICFNLTTKFWSKVRPIHAAISTIRKKRIAFLEKQLYSHRRSRVCR